MELNKIYCGDSCKLLKEVSNNFIDLTITSPPYDNLRDYKGYIFDFETFETIAKELYRITKEGGIVVWVVGDSCVKGSETGTSFRQALFFMGCGFNLHDTMIYEKNGIPFPEHTRYNQQFEYMFIFVKGKIKTFNPIKIKTTYKRNTSTTTRQKDGSLKYMKYDVGKDTRTKGNIWKYDVGFGRNTTEKYSFEHPATFPEKLAKDHIISWSNKGDIVLDPFVGSGTTCKIAKLQSRNFIGIDISEEYCNIAKKRVRQEPISLYIEKGLTKGDNHDSV